MTDFGWNTRRAFRVLVETQAAVRLHRSSRKAVRLRQKTISAKLLDIGVGGCAFESPALIPHGAKLNVFIDENQWIPSADKASKGRLIKVTGIVRTHRQLPSLKYRIGLQFEHVSERDSALIKGFVERGERRGDKRSRPLA